MNILPSHNPFDWLAWLWFIGAWLIYIKYSAKKSKNSRTLNSTLDFYRYDWMYQMLARELRVPDTQIVAVMEQNCAFFASSSLLIIAGLFTALGYINQAPEIIDSVTIGLQQDKLLIIVLVLVIIFVFAFFTFTWSMRQFGFVGFMIVSAPMPNARKYTKKQREEFAIHTSRVVDLAANQFNQGLRAFYYALATLGWVAGPFGLIATTSLVTLVLYRREFHSKTLRALRLAHKDIRPVEEDLEQN